MAKGKSDNIGKTEYAWESILDDNPNILVEVAQKGLYEIKASEIKEYREPRLMTKHDTSTGVPGPLKKKNLNVLPVSRSAYVLGNFELFKEFPDVSNLSAKTAWLPYFETLDVKAITSEANAINALIASGILEDFLGEDNLTSTFNGRMGSGKFSFCVNNDLGSKVNIEVDSAQLEIDGGFETDSSIIIMEAKNVRHDDFNIRQLYYPYRKYLEITNKPIRLVFSQYTNLTYYLYEYKFLDKNDYSSIELVQMSVYTFEDMQILQKDIMDVWKKTDVTTDDNSSSTSIPFPQADRIDRIIALLEKMDDMPDGITTTKIASFMQTTERQAAYYPSAGEYLGLFDRSERGVTKLTPKAKFILQKGWKDRNLLLASLLFQHKIFHVLYEEYSHNEEYPSLDRIRDLMREYQVCGQQPSEATISRRAQTVLAWLKWINSLTM